MRLIPPILALAVAAVPGTALACTVPAGYTAPTNWQLANDANTILLGEVVGGGVGSPADPAALGDACIRRVFAPNTQALFFLKREHGQWAPAGGPLSRWAQDVSGLDAPWVELASVYAHASMVPGEDGRQLLEQRHEALVSRPDDPQAAAMAADLERSLAGPPAPVIAEATLEPPDEAATGAQATPEPSPPDDLSEVQDAIDSFGKGQ
jgi:hypothetical protein